MENPSEPLHEYWLDFAKKYRDKPKRFWDNVLWTDVTKINLYQNDGKAKERICS